MILHDLLRFISYPIKLFQVTVMILNLEIQGKQCRKIAGKLWVGHQPGNTV